MIDKSIIKTVSDATRGEAIDVIIARFLCHARRIGIIIAMAAADNSVHSIVGERARPLQKGDK